MTKILIIDDRAINREVLSLLLDEHSYTVLEAEDGLQGIDSAYQNHPDLIITDIAMPHMDGLTLVKTLQADPKLSKIPVIFYSATYREAEAYRLASSTNVKYVLTKPCDPEIILSTIHKALHETYLGVDQSLPYMRKNENVNLRLTNLIEIGLDMSQEHNIEKLTYILCKSSRQFLDADYAGIIIQEKNNLNQYQNININKNNVLNTYTLLESDLSESLKKVFLGDKPICIHSPILDVKDIGLTDIPLPFSSLLCLPLKTARVCYGKVYFINKIDRPFFTPSDQRFMMTLADKFSVNYENLVLYQEHIQAEEKLRIYREKMADVVRSNTLGEMASSLAHEINQPLAAITAYVKGCIKRLHNKNKVTPEIIEILNETAVQAERAGEVVHRIKRFVRKGELFYEKVDINSLIEETIAMIKKEKTTNTIDISYAPVAEPLIVELDKIQIQQVILNLLRNAIEAVIEANIKNPHIKIDLQLKTKQKIKVCITDNGPGFSEQISKNLFDLYFTTKKQGMGLGLAISRSIIEAHLGHLSAMLLPKGGCCFQFELPIIRS